MAIESVVRAIRTLESPDGYLFGGLPPDTMNMRIEKFIAWASNLAESLGCPHETVPEDKYGSIGVSRFAGRWHGTSPHARAGLSPSRFSTATCAPP
ncbi:hypothetical protein [Arthrobacter sp. FW306-04-A]|uniref:hypothetical protein n=1 Tax=Arthrobacter sp. FW306-04-A TaxID=2879619 RepID=UPI0037C0178E|nr:hypothetical protein LFT43_08995 [Arthrobacter sp. FW306-04-A]